jgi:hypothetical protein
MSAANQLESGVTVEQMQEQSGMTSSNTAHEADHTQQMLDEMLGSFEEDCCAVPR